MTAVLTACGGGGGTGPAAPPPTTSPTQPPATAAAVQISADSFADPLGQHATEVEPSAAVHGQTIVAAFQTARQVVSGGSAIGVASSFDGGHTWSRTSLPFVTQLTGGGAQSASDAVVAYDAAHATWLVAVVPVIGGTVPYPEVSRSGDAIHWDAPVVVSSGDIADDKEWIACDNTATSPNYGHCYVTWDDGGRNGLIEVSVSADGGATWSAARTSADRITGIGAQALPQPNGNTVIISDDFNEASLFSFVSRDGGRSWSGSQPVAQIIDHLQLGNLRSGALVSAASDESGTLYAVWQDCRYETNCTADDLVLSTSADGLNWSAPSRLPLDPIAANVDHFIPGLGVDPKTSGSSAHVALAYYAYANALCPMGCAMTSELSTSVDGGKSWSAPVAMSPAMSLPWLARTTEGRMVADYVASVFPGATPVAVFANAFTPAAGLFNESVFAYAPSAHSVMFGRVSRNERPIAGIRPDHARRHFIP